MQRLQESRLGTTAAALEEMECRHACCERRKAQKFVVEYRMLNTGVSQRRLLQSQRSHNVYPNAGRSASACSIVCSATTERVTTHIVTVVRSRDQLQQNKLALGISGSNKIRRAGPPHVLITGRSNAHTQPHLQCARCFSCHGGGQLTSVHVSEHSHGDALRE